MVDQYWIDQNGGVIQVHGRAGVIIEPSSRSTFLVGKASGSQGGVVVVVVAPQAGASKPRGEKVPFSRTTWRKRVVSRQAQKSKSRQLRKVLGLKLLDESLTIHEVSIVKKITRRSSFSPSGRIAVFVQQEGSLRKLDPEEARRFVSEVSLQRIGSRAYASIISGALTVEPVDPIPDAPPPPPRRRTE